MKRISSIKVMLMLTRQTHAGYSCVMPLMMTWISDIECRCYKIFLAALCYFRNLMRVVLALAFTTKMIFACWWDGRYSKWKWEAKSNGLLMILQNLYCIVENMWHTRWHFIWRFIYHEINSIHDKYHNQILRRQMRMRCLQAFKRSRRFAYFCVAFASHDWGR